MGFTRYLKFKLPFLRGEDIQEIQIRLRELGYSVGKPDGLFGAKTEKVIREFQEANNLLADGIVGPNTWNIIFRAQTEKLGKLVSLIPQLKHFHSFRDSVKWRLQETGLEIENSGIELPSRNKNIVKKVWENFGSSIEKWTEKFSVPAELIVSTICTESSGNPLACREEPRFVSDDETPYQVSPGLMQTLISTARSALDDDSIDREWLFVPDNSIKAGTAYIAQQWKKSNFDPPKVASAYNAGGVYHNDGVENRWKMRQYPLGTSHHADRFVRWFNQFIEFMNKENIRPSVNYLDLLS